MGDPPVMANRRNPILGTLKNRCGAKLAMDPRVMPTNATIRAAVLVRLVMMDGCLIKDVVWKFMD